jgi:hypothetical protein
LFSRKKIEVDLNFENFLKNPLKCHNFPLTKPKWAFKKCKGILERYFSVKKKNISSNLFGTQNWGDQMLKMFFHEISFEIFLEKGNYAIFKL